jgi:sugar transferase (PEP-CTERM/EpsH1 system associated)
MRILYLAHRLPYPPNKGDKIRSYHHVRHLAAGNDVHLLAFIDDPDDEQWVARLRDLCREVVPVRLDRRRGLMRGLRAWAEGRSLSEGFFGSSAMTDAVRHVATRTPPDVAWAFSSVMAQYLPAATAPRTIVDVVDVDSEKWRQFARDSHQPLRAAYGLEARRLRAFEEGVGRTTDQVLFVSEGEAELFRSFGAPRARVLVVPNGVDTDYFNPEPRTGDRRAAQLLFTGALDYRPNVDAVLAFARDVLPRVRAHIPEAQFTAVGHRPARLLLRHAQRHPGDVQVMGSVPDVRPYFRQAQVYVAPLRLGRGVQNKILEAMAMRVPVVASPLAVSGLSVTPGTHVLVARTPQDYADAVVGLLRSPAERERLAAAAARLIAGRYTWAGNLSLLDDCLAPASDIRADEWTACSA